MNLRDQDLLTSGSYTNHHLHLLRHPLNYGLARHGSLQYLLWLLLNDCTSHHLGWVDWHQTHWCLNECLLLLGLLSLISWLLPHYLQLPCLVNSDDLLHDLRHLNQCRPLRCHYDLLLLRRLHLKWNLNETSPWQGNQLTWLSRSRLHRLRNQLLLLWLLDH